MSKTELASTNINQVLMPDLVQLRCFVALEQERHFGRAARRLNMTQPPFSRHITQLERRLGVALFTRSTRAVRPTTAGLALLPQARRILALLDNFEAAAKQLTQGEAGVLTFGFTSGTSYVQLPRLVAIAARAAPAVHLELRELGTEEQMQALGSGALDLGIVRPPPTQADVELVTIHRESLRLAVPAAHRLATARLPIKPAQLTQERFLTYSADENRYFHDVVAAAMRQAGLLPARMMQVRSVNTILALVAIGAGLAIVPDSAEQIGPSGVVLRRLDSAFAATIDHCLAWRGDNMNPSLKRLIPLFLDEIARAGRTKAGRDKQPRTMGRGARQ